MISQMTHEGMEQGRVMVDAFQIQQYRNSDNLHLRLTGILDEEAALTLMEMLNGNRASVQKIFVHTAALDEVMDSGAELFRSSLTSLDLPGAEIIFTGKKGAQLSVKAPGIRLMR